MKKDSMQTIAEKIHPKGQCCHGHSGVVKLVRLKDVDFGTIETLYEEDVMGAKDHADSIEKIHTFLVECDLVCKKLEMCVCEESKDYIEMLETSFGLIEKLRNVLDSFEFGPNHEYFCYERPGSQCHGTGPQAPGIEFYVWKVIAMSLEAFKLCAMESEGGSHAAVIGFYFRALHLDTEDQLYEQLCCSGEKYNPESVLFLCQLRLHLFEQIYKEQPTSENLKRVEEARRSICANELLQR
eukprot:Nk52_evm26s62 gene=Nk52_evmTU26s62